MQNLSKLGRKQSVGGAESKIAEVWRIILSNCTMGDTLVLDFNVPTATGAGKSKVASCSGSVTAVVDKSKKTPTIMFRAEGFREQVQLPPVISLDSNQNQSLGLKGTDAASLLEFLGTSRLVGACVLRKERAEATAATKVIFCIGTRKNSAADVAKKSENVAPLPVDTEVNKTEVAPALPPPDVVCPPPLLEAVKPEGFVKPEPQEDEGWGGECPHYILTAEQKAAQIPKLFERLYVDEATAAHIGAGLLLSMLANRNSNISEGATSSFFAPSRFQTEYTNGSVSTKSATSTAENGVNGTERHYDDEDDNGSEDNSNPMPTQEEGGTMQLGTSSWEPVGAGAFATVYKVSADHEVCSSDDLDTVDVAHIPNVAAIKVVRSILHSCEENNEESQLGLYQKFTAFLRATVSAEHVSSSPHAISALSLPSKAAFALAKAQSAELRAKVGLSAKSSRAQEGNLSEQLRPSHLDGSQWYTTGEYQPATDHVDLIDVYHMQLEAGDNKGKSKRAHAPRISFFPFDHEVKLLLEWRDFILAELQRVQDPQSFAESANFLNGSDERVETKLQRAQGQHCYSLYLGNRNSWKRQCKEVIRGAVKEPVKAASGSNLSVADIFASRRVADPASVCGMTIQRPVVSSCRLGFGAGSLGIRQSVVGELLNLQLCSGKENVVLLKDWGYRAPRVYAAIQTTISFLVSMIENTSVGSMDLGAQQRAQPIDLVPSEQNANSSIVTYITTRHRSTNPPSRQGYTRFPMYPTLDHLVACSQAHLTIFGVPSLLEGVVGIVTPHYDEPLHRLQRKLVGAVNDRRTIVEMIESEFKERISVLRRMHEFRVKKERYELSKVNGGGYDPRPLTYLPMRQLTAPSAAPIEPPFVNPFGYQLADPHTQYWIQQLPQLEALLADESNPNVRRSDQILLHARRPVPAASTATVSTLAPLEESIARYVLPNRFTVRRERFAFAVGVLKDLVPALQSLHRSDIIHRDVKPNNIMMSTRIEYTVPIEGYINSKIIEGLPEVPTVFFDFLGRPENLLRRHRHVFHLIDLGWGRVLPHAMVSMKPLEGTEADQRSSSDVPRSDGEHPNDYDSNASSDVGEDWEAFATKKHQKNISSARHYEDEPDYPNAFGDNTALGNMKPSGLSMALLNQSKLEGDASRTNRPSGGGLQSWMENLAGGAGTSENTFALSGYKRPREDIIELSNRDGGGARTEAPRPLEPHLPKLNPRTTLPAMSILPVVKPLGEDARLYSMQRKMATMRPTEPKFTFTELAAMGNEGTEAPPKDVETATSTSSQEESTSGTTPSVTAAPAQSFLLTRDFLMSGPAGNVCYRAPEFMFGPHELMVIEGACSPDHMCYAYNAAVDVFALGSVLFELLTGTRMFKLRSNEIHQGEAELRNGQLLHRMVESLGYPKVWVAEAVVQIRHVRDVNHFPNIIKTSPFAASRMRSASAATTAYTYIGLLQTFLLSDSIRRNRIIDASTIDSALAYAWEEVVSYTTTKAKLLSMSEANGLTGSEHFVDEEHRKDGAPLAPHLIIPARLLGQHGYAGLVYQSLEQSQESPATTTASYAFIDKPVSKRPSTTTYVLKQLQKVALRPCWCYEPKAPAHQGFRGLLEIDADRRMREEKALSLSAVAEAVEAGLPKPTETPTAPLRGTFTNALFPSSKPASTNDIISVKEGDSICELVGLVSRMLSWEPSERPSMAEILESGSYQLLCGGDRGYFDS